MAIRRFFRFSNIVMNIKYHIIGLSQHESSLVWIKPEERFFKFYVQWLAQLIASTDHHSPHTTQLAQTFYFLVIIFLKSSFEKNVRKVKTFYE